MKKLLLIMLLFATPAVAGEATLGVKANIINISELPIKEAFKECERLNLVCRSTCKKSTIYELKQACTMDSMMCCDMARPYMDKDWEWFREHGNVVPYHKPRNVEVQIDDDNVMNYQ